MEIIASDLKDVLARLSTALTNKGLVENADKFVFNENTIHVFDGEVFIRADFETGLKGAVEGQSFLKYIDKMSTNKIELTQSDKTIDIKKGRSVASFIIEEDSSYPIEFEEIEWRKAPANLISALTTCSYTCGKDYTDMRTVVVHVFRNYAESTDEERITRFKLDGKMREELFIPCDVVPYLSRAKITKYAKTEDWMLFENQNGDLICHRNVSFGEDYQDLGAVIEECSGGSQIELPDKMYDAVEKAAIFQSDLKIDSDRKVTIRNKNDKIRVESNGTHGNFLEILPSGIEENFTFTINPGFMTQIMEKSNTVYFHEDYIRIETSDYVFLTTLAAE